MYVYNLQLFANLESTSRKNRMDTYERKLAQYNKKLSKPNKVNRQDDTIFTKQALEEIELELKNLKDYKKLSFKHSLIKNEIMNELDDTMNVRSVRRVVKLRFRCINQKCPQFHVKKSKHQKQSELNRRWTSYYGLVDFRFFFEKASDKNSTLLKYSFYIYNQKCKTCQTWGKCGLIETCFVNLLYLYRLMLQECLKKIKERKESEIRWRTEEKYGLRPNMKGAFNGHLTELCEACAERVCLRFYEEIEIPENDSSDDEADGKEEAQEPINYIVSGDVRGRHR